jgi:hypothetical protein
MMNANSNYSALKKAIGELTEVIDRSQPSNEEAGTLLKRMDSIVIDIEIRFAGVLAAHHTISSGSFLAPN